MGRQTTRPTHFYVLAYRDETSGGPLIGGGPILLARGVADDGEPMPASGKRDGTLIDSQGFDSKTGFY